MNNTNEVAANLPNGQEKFYFGVDDVTEYFGTNNNLTRIWHNYERNVTAIGINRVPSDDGVRRFGFTENKITDGSKQTEYDYRNFSRKFYKTPKEALINAVYRDSNLTTDPEIRKRFFSNLKFNSDTKCFEYYDYVTTGTGLYPKKIHMERFLNGDYNLYVDKHEIQILSSNIENVNLNEIIDGEV